MQSVFSESLRLYAVSLIENLEHKYSRANPSKDLEIIVAFSVSCWRARVFHPWSSNK